MHTKGGDSNTEPQDLYLEKKNTARESQGFFMLERTFAAGRPGEGTEMLLV